jgi:hypothetical protein
MGLIPALIFLKSPPFVDFHRLPHTPSPWLLPAALGLQLVLPFPWPLRPLLLQAGILCPHLLPRCRPLPLGFLLAGAGFDVAAISVVGLLEWRWRTAHCSRGSATAGAGLAMVVSTEAVRPCGDERRRAEYPPLDFLPAPDPARALLLCTAALDRQGALWPHGRAAVTPVAAVLIS